MSILFKSKVYFYYLGYIVSILLFIVCVYFKEAHIVLKETLASQVLMLSIDFVQIVCTYMFGGFLYETLLIEDSKHTKLVRLFKCYSLLVVAYLAVILIFPKFVLKSVPYFIVTRIIVIAFSASFYVTIIKNLHKKYFRFLFLAVTFLFLFGFMSFWDSIEKHRDSSTMGFQYLCIGYVLENICFVCAFIYKYFSTDQQKKEAEIKHELQLSMVQLEVQQQTIQHIGREIHDNVGQKLTLASLYTQQLEYENKAPLVKNSIKNISEIINQALEELRLLSKSLTNNAIDSQTLSELLSIECERFNELKKCDIELKCQNEMPDLSYKIKSILLRIAQEFIQNSIKHSDCQKIHIDLKADNGNLILKLKDDGHGFNSEKTSETGTGLKHIKTRASLIGASSVLTSKPKNGTQLIITLPL